MRPEPLDSLLRDVEVVQIYYAPETRIILGGSLNQENIKEKSDVYFECLVNSNPTATNIQPGFVMLEHWGKIKAVGS